MCKEWQIALPFRGQAPSKTRLHLPNALELAEGWLEVAQQAASAFGRVEVVGQQYGPGLNQALSNWRKEHGSPRWAIILPDLPSLQSADVEALLQACPVGGLALAPDRHGQGTNAIAGYGVFPDLVFGRGSLARFLAQDFPHVLVERAGLSHDVDTLEDLQAL
jgi:2-phospho-L-lactate guanylyltransferase (CobY/MobA/RfbA family)